MKNQLKHHHLKGGESASEEDLKGKQNDGLCTKDDGLS